MRDVIVKAPPRRNWNSAYSRLGQRIAHDFILAGGPERDLQRLVGWSSEVRLERDGASSAGGLAREAGKRVKQGDLR